MRMRRDSGVSLILLIIMSTVLMFLAIISIDATMTHSVVREVQADAFEAREIGMSGATQALTRIREGGYLAPYSEPISGGSGTPQWVSFGNGEFYYYSSYDSTNELTTVRAWGRVAVNSSASGSSVAPDDVNWDGTGYEVEGVEFTVAGGTYTPEFPIYVGNGGIERPLGGFDWTDSTDPFDPSTWTEVTSSPASTQASGVPFEPSAKEHPQDYIANGGSPASASQPHKFQIIATQNTIGQKNVEAWFANSAGTGNDPLISVTPPIDSSHYDLNDKKSTQYPYLIDPTVPDVQDFSWELWSRFKDDTSGIVNKLSGGSLSGTYGSQSNPEVTFVTGGLTVDSGTTFEGTGVLVIRDDYDPNVDTDNTPSVKADMFINGTFKWTGLVILAGWAPSLRVSSTGDSTIVGSFFAEDSVQSGGEISLDSATVVFDIQGPFRVKYNNTMFLPGGLLENYMPRVEKEVVGIRDI